MKRALIILLLPLLFLLMALAWILVSDRFSLMVKKSAQTSSVAQRLDQYGAPGRARLKPFFERADVPYPPRRVTFAGLKAERVLQVYAADAQGQYRFIRSYPVLGASGGLGPKLREGDRQVPEGIYQVESLNPNSRHHLALRIGYPNADDLAQAATEGRTNLGGDIMIHGGSASIGCLAIGDEAAEDLFVLAADTKLENLTVVLSPVDFRTGASLPETVRLPEWTTPLYTQIRARLAELPPEGMRRP
jgi:hypothetical protein